MEGSYLRLIDSFITQLKAQGPSRTCNASKEEEEEGSPGEGGRETEAARDDRRPFVGAFQGRSWSHWVVLGAILWVFIAKN